MNIWDWLCNLVETGLNAAVDILPPSPFTLLQNETIGKYLGWLNWCFPISEVLVTLEVWIVAVGVFYAVQAVLRWVKAIE